MMEEKKVIKISFKKAIIIMLIVLLILAVAVFLVVRYTNDFSTNELKETSTANESISNEGSSKDKDIIKEMFPDVETLKPIIYLYPTEDTEVSVELGYPENITVSYPEYKEGWKVLAKTDGTLIDLETNRSLYSLYYEGISAISYEVTDEGFVVKGEDVAEFLEEKLAILGLTEREAEEFIIYWLPKLQENEYNYIRFATAEEIEETMPLTIEPNPDTIIRVLMIYKGLDEPIEVQEQELETPERTGFVAVEWGGAEI